MNVVIISPTNPTRTYSSIIYLTAELKKSFNNVDLWCLSPKANISETKKYDISIHSFYDWFIGRIPRLRGLILPFQVLFIALKMRKSIIIFHELRFIKIMYLVKVLFPKTKMVQYCSELYDGGLEYLQKRNLKFNKKHANFPDLLIDVDQLRCEYRKIIYNLKIPTTIISNSIPRNEVDKLLEGLNRFDRMQKNIIPRVIYIGGANTDRELAHVLKALAKINLPMSIEFYCHGIEKDIKKFSDMCNELLVNKLFKLEIDVPRELLFKKIYNADVGICYYKPSDNLNSRYAAPSKIYEYIGLNIPIVCSNNDSLMPLIDQYNLGAYVMDESIESLSNAIISLISNHSKCDEIKKSQKESFESILCYEEQCKDAIKKIKALIS